MTHQQIIESVQMRFPQTPAGWILLQIGNIQSALLGAEGTVAAVATFTNTTKVTFTLASDLNASWVTVQRIEAYGSEGESQNNQLKYEINPSAGTMQLYDLDGFELTAWPSGVTEILIHYLKKPAAITPATATSGSPEIPTQFHGIFEELILEKLFSEASNFGAAGMARTRAKGLELEFRRYMNTLGDGMPYSFAPGILDKD